MAEKISEKTKEAHNLAMSKNLSTYIDPNTGYMVFTETGLLAKGKCCGSKCRHCPFDHVNVPTV